MAFVNVGITHACCCIFEESSGQSLPNTCGFVAGSWAGLGRCEYSTNQHPCIEHLIFSWVVNLIKMAKQNIPNLDHLEQFHAMTVPLAANFYTVLQPFFLIILICLPSQFQVRNSKLLLIFNATDLLGATSSMHENITRCPVDPHHPLRTCRADANKGSPTWQLIGGLALRFRLPRGILHCPQRHPNVGKIENRYW